MNKNSLLTVLLLAVITTTASAAQSQPRSDSFVLPTYVVESERYASAEQHILTSLSALRAQANRPVAVSVELPALKAQVAQTAKLLRSGRLAKS